MSQIPDAPAPALRVSALSSLLRATLRDRSFLSVLLILLAAALGLNASVRYLNVYFKKEPVPMRQAFPDSLPETLGPWVRVATDEVLDPDLLSALATKDYLFCVYVNSAELGMTPAQLLEKHFMRPASPGRPAERKSPGEQKEEVVQLIKTYKKPAAILNLGLSYYTGKADTVAHIPERCYVGDGFEPNNPQTLAWDLQRNLSVRQMVFESTRLGRPPCNVAYFFHVNGRYESDSLAVRRVLQNLLARHGYYAKVELMCQTKDNRAAEQSMKAFLTLALPFVEQALPDWTQYESRR